MVEPRMKVLVADVVGEEGIALLRSCADVDIKPGLMAFAKRHKKTDKIDARLIANILQKGFLPVVAIADQHTRQVRELLRYRIRLVIDRSRNISRLKALLDKLGINSNSDFTTYKRLKTIIMGE